VWLASVWIARDYEAKKKGTRSRERNKTAINFIQRWRKRISERPLVQTDEKNREVDKTQGEGKIYETFWKVIHDYLI
jgi:hypothetical protein